MTDPDDDVSVVLLAKGTERYVWTYHDGLYRRCEVLASIARMAMDPDLSLTWLDAAELFHQVRENAEEARAEA